MWLPLLFLVEMFPITNAAKFFYPLLLCTQDTHWFGPAAEEEKCIWWREILVTDVIGTFTSEYMRESWDQGMGRKWGIRFCQKAEIVWWDKVDNSVSVGISQVLLLSAFLRCIFVTGLMITLCCRNMQLSLDESTYRCCTLQWECTLLS
jgi:hypothetical protein